MSASDELPPGWAEAQVGDILRIRNGYAFKSSEYQEHGVPLIPQTDIRESNVNVADAKRVSTSLLNMHPDFAVKKGDLLIGMSGSLGKISKYANDEFALQNQRTGLLQLEPEILTDYASYVLKYVEPQIVAEGKGIAVQNVSANEIEACRFPIAPLQEQTRIVEKLEELLSDLDAGVAELKAAQKKLRQYRQSLLKAAVEGALTADWRSKHKPLETGAQLLERILQERRARWEAKQLAKFKEQGKTPPKDWQKKYIEPMQADTSGLPQLPEGWVWASLDMLGEIASGVAKGTKRDAHVQVREVPYLRVANVQRGFLDLSEVKTILATERDIDELTLQAGDVLFNEGGDRDKLGRGWVWREEVANCIHQNHVFRMRPYLPELLPELISHHGNTFGKTWFQNAGKQTTNLASINMTMLRVFPVPLGPALEQQELLTQLELQIENLDRQERAVELGLKQSTAQRQNILKAAFSGQIVPQDPNDEPASVLLARIRAERSERDAVKKPRGVKLKAKT